MTVRILHGDCLEILPTLAAESVHAVITDPPYHLTSIVKRFGGKDAAPAQYGTDGAFARASKGFMGQVWDGGDIAFRPEVWAQVLRVMKPGAHLLAFGGTRTSHRMVCAIEDAGFEIRDTLCWLYGSGFPKSHDISKGIDRAAGAEREVVGVNVLANAKANKVRSGVSPFDTELHDGAFSNPDRIGVITAPATPEAAQWSGWGTALKPAYEPIILARKPFAGTIAANTLQHGCGGLNIDACRVETDLGKEPDIGSAYYAKRGMPYPTDDSDGSGGKTSFVRPPHDRSLQSSGRWPANVAHDGSNEVEAAFAAFGTTTSSDAVRNNNTSLGSSSGGIYGKGAGFIGTGHSDTGTASRFFFSGKATADDRMDSKHPTVKPLALMAWLVKLVTPPGGTVLDPFSGSGTTLLAADRLQFHAIGIEQNAEYVADSERRLHIDKGLFANM